MREKDGSLKSELCSLWLNPRCAAAGFPRLRDMASDMSALPNIEMRPVPVRAALLVGEDSRIEEQLRAILEHADHYGLKWVFVRDHYYDPLLSFAGWRPVDSVESNTITVWSKDGVPPATPLNAPQIPPQWQGMMWGILPIGSSILALLVLLIPERKPLESRVSFPSPAEEELVSGRLAS